MPSVDDRPIGMFDSGFGGLTVARALIDLLPDEDLVYVGDTGRYPYGPRPLDEVREFARQITAKLIDEHDVKMVVVACNTASAAALDLLRFEHDVPVLGPIVFAQTWLVYASWVCVVLVALYLSRTRPGLNVRAVGESPAAADAMGINVTAYRYAHTLVGGAFAGVGGATFSLSITPQWVAGLTQGAGWIAIALVIFAFWRPTLCLVGAYFFGAFTALPFALQGHGVTVAPELFQALPYVMTVLALVLVSSRAARLRFGAPAALGLPYVREER